MTTMTTLDDVRANLIERGYPTEQVDEMLDLAGRMILEGSLASKDDVVRLRDEFTLFKIDVAERFAELRTEMHAGFAELRGEMASGLAELRGEMASGLAELRAEMHAGLAELRGEMDGKLAELRGEMHSGFAELRSEMDAKFAEQNSVITAKFAEQNEQNANRESRIVKWVFGGVIAGIAINAAVVSIAMAAMVLMD